MVSGNANPLRQGRHGRVADWWWGYVLEAYPQNPVPARERVSHLWWRLRALGRHLGDDTFKDVSRVYVLSLTHLSRSDLLPTNKYSINTEKNLSLPGSDNKPVQLKVASCFIGWLGTDSWMIYRDSVWDLTDFIFQLLGIFTCKTRIIIHVLYIL